MLNFQKESKKKTKKAQISKSGDFDLKKRNVCSDPDYSCQGNEICCNGKTGSEDACCDSDCLCCPSSVGYPGCYDSTYYDSRDNVTVTSSCCPSADGFACNTAFPVCGVYFCWRYGLTECAFPISSPSLNQSVGCDTTETCCANAGTCCDTKTQTCCPSSDPNINGICCLKASQTCCNSKCIDATTEICCSVGTNQPSVLCKKSTQKCCSGGCCDSSSLTSSTGVNVLGIVLGIFIPICIIASIILAYFLWKRKRMVKVQTMDSSPNQINTELK